MAFVKLTGWNGAGPIWADFTANLMMFVDNSGDTRVEGLTGSACRETPEEILALLSATAPVGEIEVTDEMVQVALQRWIKVVDDETSTQGMRAAIEAALRVRKP